MSKLKFDSNDYYAIVTTKGQDLINKAYNEGKVVNLVDMAIGDSNGSYVAPDPSFTALAHEFGRQPLEAGEVYDAAISAAITVKPDYAGNTVREFGLYDDAGNLIIYGSYPESLIIDNSGSSYMQLKITVNMYIVNASAVNIIVNPTIPYATEEEPGIVEQATAEEVKAGVDNERYVTPKNLHEVLPEKATEDRQGIVEQATKDETIGGSDNERYVTPKHLMELLNLVVPVGVIASWPLLTKPDGVFWDICDGDDFDKAANPKLAILYPSGKKPDLRGRVIEYYKSDAEGAVGSLQAGSIGEHVHDNSHGHSAEQDEHNHPSKSGHGLPVNGPPTAGGVDITSSSPSGHYVDLGDAFEPAKPDVRVENHSGNTGSSGSGRNTVDRYIGVAVIRMG
ncbi:phage tail protein [Photobacterium damselae subsp. damselae]|uniref:phage tail protein n=1 Tax=Photobacterium damselae TaxID=38293 RepID=UPI00311B3E91